jgi:PAS domain-containing protein
MGKGTAAGLALYAAILDERIEQVVLFQPPSTHVEGPFFLGVLRYTDLPEAAALVAPRRVLFYNRMPPAYEAARRVFELHGKPSHLSVTMSVQGPVLQRYDHDFRIWLVAGTRTVRASSVFIWGRAASIFSTMPSGGKVRRAGTPDVPLPGFDAITDAMIAIDRNWRCVQMNRAAEVVAGKSGDELAGRTLWELFPELRERRSNPNSAARWMNSGLPSSTTSTPHATLVRTSRLPGTRRIGSSACRYSRAQTPRRRPGTQRVGLPQHFRVHARRHSDR